MSAGHLLVAYHGCDIVVRDTLVAGKLAALRHSRNKYDWLGPGSYFFEGDSERALKFAQASSAYPERMYTRNPILRPSVVGAVLCVQNWLDMTTQRGIREFVDAHDAMVATLQASRKPLPENRPAGPGDDEILLRRLDNAVFCYLHAARATVCRHLPYQAVRGGILARQDRCEELRLPAGYPYPVGATRQPMRGRVVPSRGKCTAAR